jgi:protein-arginine kinase activator protein McsA
MSENEFRQPISIDFAPSGSVCEWCGKPATQQLTAIGGRSHNEGGYFCGTCGAEFARTVAESMNRVPTPEEVVGTQSS